MSNNGKKPKVEHLCRTCCHGIKTETEAPEAIYVSFGCTIPDIEEHCLIIHVPYTDCVLECPKYKKASPYERARRKLFWWL